MKHLDQCGRSFCLESRPKRIVSLVPSQTELLVDLGLEEYLVGITKFCVHPARLKATKTIVGGTKTLHLDKIKALAPDFIICNKEENTQEIVAQVSEIAPTYVSDIYTIEDALSFFAQIGSLLGANVAAQLLIQKIRLKQADFEHYMKDKKTLKAAYFIWANPWMVAGNTTYIDHLLGINKLENIYATRERYPEISLKKIRLEGDPDIVLLSSEPFPFKDKHAFEIGRFTHHAKTVFVDGEMFSWYGSRLTKAFDYFMALQKRLRE